MFEKGAAPATADLAGETNPPLDPEAGVKFIFGVQADRVEADAETYRSYADRMLDQAMQDVLPAATVKWYEQKAAEYNAWEKQQVTNAVTAEVEEHCATAGELRTATGNMIEELTSLSADIKARSLTTVQALSKFEAIQQQAARLRQSRDHLAASTQLSDFKLAHPHRYMDHMHQAFQTLPRKAVFER